MKINIKYFSFLIIRSYSIMWTSKRADFWGPPDLLLPWGCCPLRGGGPLRSHHQIPVEAFERAVTEKSQLWEMIVWFLRTSWPPLGLRLLPVKGGWTFKVTSPNSCWSFCMSRNGEESTLRDDCMVFEDLLTSSYIYIRVCNMPMRTYLLQLPQVRGPSAALWLTLPRLFLVIMTLSNLNEINRS